MRPLLPVPNSNRPCASNASAYTNSEVCCYRRVGAPSASMLHTSEPPEIEGAGVNVAGAGAAAGRAAPGPADGTGAGGGGGATAVDLAPTAATYVTPSFPTAIAVISRFAD